MLTTLQLLLCDRLPLKLVKLHNQSLNYHYSESVSLSCTVETFIEPARMIQCVTAFTRKSTAARITFFACLMRRLFESGAFSFFSAGRITVLLSRKRDAALRKLFSFLMPRLFEGGRSFLLFQTTLFIDDCLLYYRMYSRKRLGDHGIFVFFMWRLFEGCTFSGKALIITTLKSNIFE